MLTVLEKIEILEISRNRTNPDTAREFNQRHPNRPIPLNVRTVSKIRNKFQVEGTVHRKKRTPSFESQDTAIQRVAMVNEFFEEHPHESTRRAGAMLGIPHTVVWRILKKSKFWAYKMSVHQKLHDGDQERRKRFCQDLLNTFNQEPDFYKCILWSDEKPFRVSATFNRQNKR